METAIASRPSAIRFPATAAMPDLIHDFVAWLDRPPKTTRTYLCNLRQFVAWLRYSSIIEPIREDIINYRDWLQTEHVCIALDNDSVSGWKYRTDDHGEPLKIVCKPNTVAQYLRSVRQLFAFAAAHGRAPADIAQNIHAPKLQTGIHRKDALTGPDVVAIEQDIAARSEIRTEAAADALKDSAGRIQRSREQGKRLYAMYLLTVTAGLRTIEISRANVKDLEQKGGQTWLYIWGKGHSEPDEKKALAPEAAAAILDYLQSRSDRARITGNSPLFVSTGNRSGGRRLATTTISTMLKTAMKEAGFNSERLTAHSLRHTAGTGVMAMTKNLFATQQYMRHKNPATTEIYLHVDSEQTDAAIARNLYGYYHGSESEDPREQLDKILSRMSPQQLEQMKTIAEAMAK